MATITTLYRVRLHPRAPIGSEAAASYYLLDEDDTPLLFPDEQRANDAGRAAVDSPTTDPAPFTWSLEVDEVASLKAAIEGLEGELDYQRRHTEGHRLLATQAGGLWTITAQRDADGDVRVVGTHYPSGEIRDCTATAGGQGVAHALLQLGNTIAQDWGLPECGSYSPAVEAALDELQAGLEGAQRNIRSVQGQVGELVGALEDASRQAANAEEHAGEAYSQAEEALGYMDSAKDAAGEAQTAAEEAGQQVGYLLDQAQGASSEASEVEDYVGRMADALADLRGQL